MRKALLSICLVVATGALLPAQTRRAATFDDVLNIKAIQGATVSRPQPTFRARP